MFYIVYVTKRGGVAFNICFSCLFGNNIIDVLFQSTHLSPYSRSFFLFLRFYLFLERGEGRERNINVWLPLTYPLLGTWPTTRHVPWLGINRWHFGSQASTQSTETPVRAPGVSYRHLPLPRIQQVHHLRIIALDFVFLSRLFPPLNNYKPCSNKYYCKYVHRSENQPFI